LTFLLPSACGDQIGHHIYEGLRARRVVRGADVARPCWRSSINRLASTSLLTGGIRRS
jgi:hypothetical protein